MFKPFSKLHSSVITAAAASLILIAGTASAGPAKPGTKMFAPGGTIVDTAIAANDLTDGAFDTLLAAAQCSFFDGAVVEILSSRPQVTLFAPTNAAFEKLMLNADNICESFDANEETQGALLAILGYHVTAGRVFSNKAFSKTGSARHVEMLLGGAITTSEGKIYDNLHREVNIAEPLFDIPASNGVIHVIDTVLLPFAP